MSTAETLSPSERLVAIEEIRSLSAEYALGLDEFDMQKILAPFSDDCVFDASSFDLGEIHGRDELREFFVHNNDVMETQIHLFSNFVIDVSSTDRASGTNYLFQDGFTKEGAQIVSYCLNRDEYTKGESGWKISRRHISALLPPRQDGYK